MTSTGSSSRNGDCRRQVVTEFCSNVLSHGRDVYGGEETPLLTDGLNVRTGQPVTWRWEGKRPDFGPPGEWIISNLAQQQNLFRTLVGLSNVTGDERYRQAAVDAIQFHYDRFQDPSGLMRWGGHQFIDLTTKAPQGPAFTNCHEFKTTYPFYSLLWEVDPARARHSIEATWNAHVLDWSVLDMNRHGMYGQPMGALWNNEFGDPPSFFVGKGLTFINCGSDLVYAAAHLAHATGEQGPLTWAKRLAYQYVKARHPSTHLGVYQYSQPKKEKEANSPRETRSMFGDRARNQLGPEFGDIALEGNVLLSRHAHVIYGNAAIVQLQVAEKLGEPGQEFLDWVREGLVAYAAHGYDGETGLLKPLLVDGTDLSGFRLARDGYYGAEGTALDRVPAGSILLWSYLLCHRLTGDPILWDTARQMARHHGLGDLGRAPGTEVAVDLDTSSSEPLALFGLLEVVRQSRHPDYLDLARRIGDNIARDRFHGGYFLPSANHLHAKFDAIEPLALLSLEAMLDDTADRVPEYNTGMGFLHGWTDDETRTKDSDYVYGATI